MYYLLCKYGIPVNSVSVFIYVQLVRCVMAGVDHKTLLVRTLLLATGLCREADESNPHRRTLILKDLSVSDVKGRTLWTAGLWFEVFTEVVIKSTVFWNITLCSPLNVNRRFGGKYRLHIQGRRISRARNQRESRWQAYSCTLKMEAICSSETLVDIQRTTRRYISEDSRPT
jgi:hypothetical protein